MKLLKITLVAGALATVSGMAVAQGDSSHRGNTSSVETKVYAYVASGLSVAVTKRLKFSDIVEPATGGVSGMALYCNGTVRYLNQGSTPNASMTEEGAGANADGNKQASQVGEIKVTGEPHYAISISATTGPKGPGIKSFGVRVMPHRGGDQSGEIVLKREARAVSQSGKSLQTSLDGSGDAFANLCGHIHINAEAKKGKLTVPVYVTVNYR